MDVKILGAAREVGRSGFLVEQDDSRILMDYGVMFQGRDRPPKLPLPVQPKDLDGVIVTHAHLDHSGNVPSLYDTTDLAVYATAPTFDLTNLLINDMLRLQKTKQYHFDTPHLNNMLRNAHDVEFEQKVQAGSLSFELRRSGHVVGGSTILVEGGGKRLFYTGDIKVSGSRLVGEADLDIGEIDLLITESTYSQSQQTPRAESEQALIEFANETLDNGGTIFIPAFSVERAQEILCVLAASGFKHRIIMDGMALQVNDIIMNYPRFHRDPQLFKTALKSSTPIWSRSRRRKMLQQPCAVISPAGMLVGGNALFYLQELAGDKKNGIALVSYQGEGTPGRRLLDEGKVTLKGKDHNVTAAVRQFQFSGHSDSNDLFDMIGKIRGDPKVLTVHGDSESCDLFAQQIHDKFGLEASAADIGQTVTV